MKIMTKERRKKTMGDGKIVLRSVNLEDVNLNTDNEEGEGIVEGRPIVTERTTEIMGLFREVIDRKALEEADLSDVMLLTNHNDAMIPLARHRRGKRSTMDIAVDDQGLTFRAKLDIKGNPTASETWSAIHRGDINQMSFAFTVGDEEWSDLNSEMPTRRIKKIEKVFEISAVNEAAYPQTSISARSADSLENDKIALDNAKSVALENEKVEAEQKAEQELSLAKKKFIWKEANKRNYVK